MVIGAEPQKRLQGAWPRLLRIRVDRNLVRFVLATSTAFALRRMIADAVA
jgi:hypothetical protein